MFEDLSLHKNVMWKEMELVFLIRHSGVDRKHQVYISKVSLVYLLKRPRESSGIRNLLKINRLQGRSFLMEGKPCLLLRSDIQVRNEIFMSEECLPSSKCSGRTLWCSGHGRPTAKQYSVPTVRAAVPTADGMQSMCSAPLQVH